MDGPTLRQPPSAAPLSPSLLRRIDGYWRAANYLSVGQIYLRANPLLEVPLSRAHIKPRLLGHWGTVPGQNFIQTHLNRVIVDHGLNLLLVNGPGHGGAGVLAHRWLDGSYSERYPEIGRDRDGMERLFRQFSWPYGVGGHGGPGIPGSIHDGGELGYSLAHACGAAFDNPGLTVACVIGDGEAETAALAASWHADKFLNPARDGAVLPILHLNGWKGASPAMLARIGDAELAALLHGYGYSVCFVSGEVPLVMHQQMAAALDWALDEIRSLQGEARGGQPGAHGRRRDWPMIVLRTPKGWTGPKQVDGLAVEGSWRSHQLPVADVTRPAHLAALDAWLRSYGAEQLFDAGGTLLAEFAALIPAGTARIGMNPHANGGSLLMPLAMPPFRDYMMPMAAPGAARLESTRLVGALLRDLLRQNAERHHFRLFGADESRASRLDAVYSATARSWMAERSPADVELDADGRVMDLLSQQVCQGWLEGYLLTGRHGLFACGEAYAMIVASMVDQHARWLRAAREIPWRTPIASLNYLLTSHVWQPDHDGYPHQDPGFIDHLASKKSGVVRLYLPPDANCLLAIVDHCLRSRDLVNVIVAGTLPAWQWLDADAVVRHCADGAGIWAWAGNDGGDPDVVIACAGDVPTREALAAVMLLRASVPGLRLRVVNVVDLMTLVPRAEHPHGMEDDDFEALFTADRPVIFAFHGYPALIHKLIHARRHPARFHVHGYREEGTTTTPFDLLVLNGLDRYQLALDAVRRVPRLAGQVEEAVDRYWAAIDRHRRHIGEHGDDLPEIRDWRWLP